ncbi:hypothetical protein RchiOBHm_Chr2g0169921 [Rosa chinensis]|uniref:Uncharacterized protein n=1 Tax=Rosa chinensis TaxID=74649 RepID=A0A2P6S4Z5_ROSCH|nr:hypothetical protein RchiOBHm_Chr2g0169921 [Rosa chinensis]
MASLLIVSLFTILVYSMDYKVTMGLFRLESKVDKIVLLPYCH